MNANANFTVQTKEAQKLIRQSERESTQWMQFAKAVQVENTALMVDVDSNMEQLELVNPENIATVKRYQQLMKDLQKSQITMGKEKHNRVQLEKILGELEVELEKEKQKRLFILLEYEL